MNHIYFVCSHFTYLTLYQGMSGFFRENFPGVKRSLILVDYPPFSILDLGELERDYDFVHRVKYHETAGTRNWRKEYRLGAIRNRVSSLRDFLDDTSQFTFEEGSLFLISEMTEATPAVRLLIAKLRRESRTSVICRIGTCFHRAEECKTNNWLSWIENNLYVLFGASAVSVSFLQWTIADRRFYSEQKVVDHHLVFSNRWATTSEYEEVIYPAPVRDQPVSNKREYVVYFDRGVGSLSLYPEMSVERTIEMTNNILKALTRLYEKQNVDLLLKPHPRARDVPYDLAGFKIFEDDVTAEMMFMQEARDIRAVYSPTSTTVRTASLFGIPSYMFLEMYGFPEEFENRVRRNLLDFSDVINVQDLNDLELPPPAASRVRPGNNEDLGKLADLFRRITPEISG